MRGSGWNEGGGAGGSLGLIFADKGYVAIAFVVAAGREREPSHGRRATDETGRDDARLIRVFPAGERKRGDEARARTMTPKHPAC